MNSLEVRIRAKKATAERMKRYLMDAFAQPAAVRTPSDIDLDDFEEIIGEGDLPF